MSRSVLVVSVLLETPHSVFSGIVVGEDQRRRFIAEGNSGIARPPTVGEVWRIAGQITKHVVHGEQVIIDTAVLERPTGRTIIHLLAGPRFNGVGPRTAERLWEAHGEDLYRILAEADENALTAVTGCDTRGRTQAATIIEGWIGLAIEADTMNWLDRHAIEPRLALKIIGCYGAATVTRLTDDPYRLTVFGAPWIEADRIARALGIDLDHPHRLTAAVEQCAHRRFTAAGDTWVSGDNLRRDIANLIGSELADLALTAAVNIAAVHKVPGGLQSAGCHALEQYIAQGLANRLLGPTANRPVPASPTIDDAIDRWGAKSGMTLNDGQRRAVAMALEENFAVLIGGAGTGKTATLKSIAELAQEAGDTVILLALSGRAALRITEATGLHARTIAGFLQMHERNAEDLPERPLIIVDEASMVDVTLLYRILSVVQEKGRLLLVGDPAQLPPIGPGLTLHTLADHPSVPLAALHEIVRQAATTGIPAAGQAIREGIVPDAVIGPITVPGVCFIDCAPEQIADATIAVQRKECDGAQIISAFKGKPSAGGGTRYLNALCHDASTSSNTAVFGRFKHGEPVIWTQNDYDLGLMNGELGKVRGGTVAPNNIDEVLIVDFGGRIVEVTRPQARYLDLAYAITVHKAQGSAFDVVIIPIVDHVLLDRTMIYTALTRARHKAVFVGDRQAFYRAITEPPSSGRRRSALAWHLDQELRHPDTAGQHACMET